MKFKWHYFFECIVIIPIMVLWIYYLHDFSIIILGTLAIVWGSLVPDADHKFDKKLHRNILFHSLLIPLGFWVMSFFYTDYLLLTALLCFSTGLHLLCDINLNPNDWGGYYTIVWCYNPITKKQYRLSGKKTTLYLFISFLLSVAILIVTIAWVM